MSKDEYEDETSGEGLFIEELAQVCGGAILIPGKYFTLARGLGEEGTTTMMGGGSESSGVPPVPVPM